MSKHIQLWQDCRGRWRWEYLDRHLRIISCSAEGFATLRLAWQHAYGCHPDATITVIPPLPQEHTEHRKDEDQQ